MARRGARATSRPPRQRVAAGRLVVAHGDRRRRARVDAVGRGATGGGLAGTDPRSAQRTRRSVRSRNSRASSPRPRYPALRPRDATSGCPLGAGVCGDRNTKGPRHTGRGPREPQVRIELTTARLRIECSTTELLWRRAGVPWLGLEPR